MIRCRRAHEAESSEFRSVPEHDIRMHCSITGPWGDRARLSAAGEQWQAFHPTGGAKELDVKRFRILGALATLCALLFAPDSAEAQAGPGLGNLDCGDQEYFRPFAFIENDGDP